MSDEMAERKIQEDQQQKTEAEKAQEAVTERSWALQVWLDPVTGRSGMTVNKNVKTRQQVDALLTVAMNDSLISAIALQILALLSQGKPKRGGGFGRLFRGH